MTPQKPHQPKLWIPFTIALAGIIATFSIWYSYINDFPFSHAIQSLQTSTPWVLLSIGVFLAILLGFAIHLMQLNRLRRQSYDLIFREFQKEIAERIHAEETKQKLEKALLQGQKLQAIGTLAGGIAHDFNNLLYAIIGYVEMARDDVPKDSLVQKNLGKVLEAAKRGQELVGRILGFSRRQHHEFTPICIKDTFEGVLALLKPTIPASVILKLDPLLVDCFVLGNQTQLHQVIVNLINNAVDAMDGEGTISIKMSRIKPTLSLRQQFPETVAENYCKIDLSDTGHGMDQSTMERIFEPFYTTKEVGKGTGLGLATVHTIMNEHQGEILVESQLGRGTTFTLFLPETISQENKDG